MVKFGHHISHQFDGELDDIRHQVMEMGGLVEQQLADALAALLEGDRTRGERAVTGDHRVNEMEVRLDEECNQILARRQPAAGDLRLVMAVIKTINDLERIGDESERIGQMAMHLSESDPNGVQLPEISSLCEHVRAMLSGALDAFARMDARQAASVAQQDIGVDNEYNAIMRNAIEAMMNDPRSVPKTMDIVWSIRSLERIGDRSRNICEYIVYFVKGKNVRHTSYEQMQLEATDDL